MGQTVLTICVSWTLMLSPIGRSPPRNAWRRQRRVRRRCTWSAASSRTDTSHLSSPPLMDYSEWRRRLPWKVRPVSLHQSGDIPTQRRADTARVGSQSLWCGPHTGASEGHGCLSTKSVFRYRNGKTGPAWNCCGKRAPPPQTNPPPTQPPNLPPPLHSHLTTSKHEVTRADDGKGDTPGEAHRHQRATCARSGNTRGDRVPLSPLEVEIPDAK